MAPQPKPTKSDEPSENVVLVKGRHEDNEIINIGPLKLEILEDGRNTDNRISTMNVIVPPNIPGPAQHWHQMHDETFLVVKGTATFYSRGTKFQANVGDHIVVPPCSPHTFGNEHHEELILFCTCTPAYYVNYFRLMAEMAGRMGTAVTPEIARRSMIQYATIETGPRHDWSKDGSPGKDPANFS